jgi:hypothetical protein
MFVLLYFKHEINVKKVPLPRKSKSKRGSFHRKEASLRKGPLPKKKQVRER